MPMLKLGSFAFELSTVAYQALQKKYACVWAKHDRLGTRPCGFLKMTELVMSNAKNPLS